MILNFDLRKNIFFGVIASLDLALDLLQPSLELKRAPEKKSLLHVPLDDKVQMQMVIFFSNEDDKSSAQEKNSDENMARFAILKIHLQAHAKLES